MIPIWFVYVTVISHVIIAIYLLLVSKKAKWFLAGLIIGLVGVALYYTSEKGSSSASE